MSFIVTAAVAIIIIVVVKLLFRSMKRQKKREPRKDGWYGKSELLVEGERLPIDDIEIKPFKIHVADEVLEDLKRRLANSRLAEPLPDNTHFHSGFNPTYMKEVIHYWKDKYDWRAQEKILNEYPQFTTQIEGLEIHFMRFKPDVDNPKVKVLPFILLHGWPSVCFEFGKVVPLLTTMVSNQDFVFEVIIPSIPGYGFSEAAHRKGMDATAAARIFAKLMVRIGHSKFFVHGGDWGSRIATNMARFFPERVLGVHVTMCLFGLTWLDAFKYILASFFPIFVDPKERYLLGSRDKLRFQLKESGYLHLNATKPETLGCAMSDSPQGLAAYLLEKYCVATNPDYLNLLDGGLTNKFTLDELLTTVMVTWINNSFTAGARFYQENIKNVLYMISERYPVRAPMGISVFPHEVLMYPRLALTGQMKNIVMYNILPRGGHFAALEEPKLLADELRTFVRTVNDAT